MGPGHLISHGMDGATPQKVLALILKQIQVFQLHRPIILMMAGTGLLSAADLIQL
jgi:hypothetical protein